MHYEKYLESEEWKRKALAAKQRANFQCALGTRHRGPFEVHHRTYERIGREAPGDLIVLCQDCHVRHHGFLTPRRLRLAQSGQFALPFVARSPKGPELN